MKHFTKYPKTPITAATKGRIDQYLKGELDTAEDAIQTRGKSCVISEDYESITFETKSGDKITLRVKKVLVPEYHLINDLGDEIYVSTDPNKDAIAFEILNEYKNN